MAVSNQVLPTILRCQIGIGNMKTHHLGLGRLSQELVSALRGTSVDKPSNYLAGTRQRRYRYSRPIAPFGDSAPIGRTFEMAGLTWGVKLTHASQGGLAFYYRPCAQTLTLETTANIATAFMIVEELRPI